MIKITAKTSISVSFKTELVLNYLNLNC